MPETLDDNADNTGWAVFNLVLDRYEGGVTRGSKPTANEAKARLSDDTHAYEIRSV